MFLSDNTKWEQIDVEKQHHGLTFEENQRKIVVSVELKLQIETKTKIITNKQKNPIL